MTFDAYHIWLGIPPEDQPPDYYRLLGLRQLESRTDVIAMAAERQTSHVRKFASGEHQQRASELLNEIAKARLVLLNPDQRLAYDRQLPAPETGAPAAPLASQPARPLPLAPQPSSPSPSPPNRRLPASPKSLPSKKFGARHSVRKRRRSSVAEWLKVAVGGVVGLLLGWWLLQTFILSDDPAPDASGGQLAEATSQPGQAPTESTLDPVPSVPPPANDGESDPNSNSAEDPPDSAAPLPSEPNANPSTDASGSSWSQLRPEEPSEPSSEIASGAIVTTDAPFERLRTQAMLRDAGDAAPISLGRLGADANQVTWTLLENLRSEPAGLELIAAEPLDRVWHVVPTTQRSRPIAAIRQSASGELNLFYSPFAAVDPAAALDRTSLALDLEGRRHTIQMTRRRGLSTPLTLDLSEDSTTIAIAANLPAGAQWRLVLLAANSPTSVATSTSPSDDVAIGEMITIAWNQDAETQLKLQPDSEGVELTLRSFYFIDPDARQREPFSLDAFNSEYRIKSRNLWHDKQALARSGNEMKQISQQVARVQKQAANARATQMAALQAQLVALKGSHRKAEASARRLSVSIPKQEEIMARLDEINRLGVKLNDEARLHVAVEMEKDGQRLRVWQAGGDPE